MKKIVATLAVVVTAATITASPAHALRLMLECENYWSWIAEGSTPSGPESPVDAGLAGCNRMYDACYRVNREWANWDPLNTGVKINKGAADHYLQNTIVGKYNECKRHYNGMRGATGQ